LAAIQKRDSRAETALPNHSSNRKMRSSRNNWDDGAFGPKDGELRIRQESARRKKPRGFFCRIPAQNCTKSKTPPFWVTTIGCGERRGDKLGFAPHFLVARVNPTFRKSLISRLCCERTENRSTSANYSRRWRARMVTDNIRRTAGVAVPPLKRLPQHAAGSHRVTI